MKKKIFVIFKSIVIVLFYISSISASSSVNINNHESAAAIPQPSTASQLNPRQRESLEKLFRESDNTKILWDRDTNIPRLISGRFFGGKSKDTKLLALDFFERYKDLFKIKNHKEELFFKSIAKDSLDTIHLKFKQRYHGLEVYGAEIAVHINKHNEITSVNGRYIPDINIDIRPYVSKSDSFKIALKDILNNIGNIPIYPSKSELIIYNDGIMRNEIKDEKLLWKVELESKRVLEKWVYFIDANAGDVVFKYDDVKSLKNRKIYSSNNTGELPGTLWITEDGPGHGKHPDIVGWLAYINAGIIYDYFYQRFRFNGWGNPLVISVHYSKYYEGAKWFNFLDTPQLICGDGDKDRKVWGPACNALDIVAHEMTHALLQYKNVNLNCCGQQGAVEESYSDIFGVFIDDSNWIIGEDFYFPDDLNKYYRSLSDPPSGAKIICGGDNSSHIQPDHMKDYDNTECDKYGIHINSGILNKAAYNIASAIGKEKTAELYYNSILYLTQDTDFIQLSNILPLICYDIFGHGSRNCNEVREGFKKVGL